MRTKNTRGVIDKKTVMSNVWCVLWIKRLFLIYHKNYQGSQNGRTGEAHFGPIQTPMINFFCRNSEWI